MVYSSPCPDSSVIPVSGPNGSEFDAQSGADRPGLASENQAIVRVQWPGKRDGTAR
jgi:hypothetical protein